MTEAYIDSDNLAEKMLGWSPEEQPKKRAGRPVAIDDSRLFGAREHLVWLFEQTWHEVGERLRWIKKPEDVLKAIHVWDDPDKNWNQHYIAKALLRSPSTPATPKWITEKRRQLGELNEALQDGYRVREKCRNALETAQRASTPDLSEGEKAIVQDQVSRRNQKLAQAEADYAALGKREREIREDLLDGEAYIARMECVRFCRANRYRLTPLNIANALAGVPYIGWRQSANRCGKLAAQNANGQAIQIFMAIERTVRSSVRRANLIKEAEKWLRAQRGKKKNLGVSALQEKWFYLRWAIKTVIEADPRVQTRELPFAIAREYWKRVSRPSNIDRLFEEEERIVS